MDHRHHAAGHETATDSAPVVAALAPTYRDPSSYELAILTGLQRLPHVYGGTVDPVTVAERRAANRRARRSRRINRLRASA